MACWDVNKTTPAVMLKNWALSLSLNIVFFTFVFNIVAKLHKNVKPNHGTKNGNKKQ